MSWTKKEIHQQFETATDDDIAVLLDYAVGQYLERYRWRHNCDVEFFEFLEACNLPGTYIETQPILVRGKVNGRED